MKDICEKHVLLSMSNGHVLEGFVSKMDNVFLTLIEHNNQKVIVRIENISFARLGNIQEVYKHDSDQFYEPKTSSEEYSIALPDSKNNDVYKRPEFVRSSQK